jgi:hypothetical protein
MGGAFTTNNICMRNAHKIPVIKLHGKLIGRPTQRCESNFKRKTDLKTKQCQGLCSGLISFRIRTSSLLF